MNTYGSEGPNAKERECIKNSKCQNLLCMWFNKNSILTLLPYLASAAADVAFIQDLNQKHNDLFLKPSLGSKT